MGLKFPKIFYRPPGHSSDFFDVLFFPSFYPTKIKIKMLPNFITIKLVTFNQIRINNLLEIYYKNEFNEKTPYEKVVE